ncbi:MAG: HEAT repeat domain-containing protein [Gemmatimonadetes bacterium]|nr:HEAT repeat domain-containing protein [Gemmatimonadota bacterium]
MTGPGPLLDSDDSQAAAEPRVDLAAVESLLQLVVKGLRAIQLYLPNNPVYQQAVANIRNAFAPVWSSTTEDLTLTVRETDFAIGDKVVLSQPAKNESIAWVLFKDGIRQVNLSPGVEEQELVNFLTVINKVRNLPPDAEDDLLTLLWQQDFQHIRYAFVEMGSEDVPSLGAGEAAPKLASGAAPSAGGISRASLESDVRGGGAGEAEAETGGGKPAGVVSMEDFDPTLYFLDDSEVEYLKGEIDREYKQDLRGNVLAILFDLLELQTYSTVRAELISIVENFIPYLLAVGDFRSVALVLRELKVVLQRAREMLPEHRQAMEQLPSRLSQPDALAQLLQSLDEAVVFPSEDELGELFRELKAEALETVFAWLPKLSNQRVRELLDAAAQRLALAYPNEMTKTLGSSDDTIALEAVRLVSRLKLPPAVPALGELLGHENTAVRVAVVEALAAIGSPGALQQLEKALDDGDRDVRLATVRTMTAHGQRSAYAKIEAAVSGKALRMADLTEKVAFFEAYGRLGGPEGVDQLAAMLDAKGGFLKRKEDPETRACAAMALGKIGTEKAKQVLQLAAQDKEPLVRNAANKALRELQ